MTPERVCVMGLGTIGLPTASILATKGLSVLGVDQNASRVEALNAGRMAIRETALEVMLNAAITSGHLKASTEPAEADVFVITEHAPLTAERQPDISRIERAVREIAPFVRPGNLVVLETTGPIGTTERSAAILAEARPDLTIASRGSGDAANGQRVSVAHCPERVLPGQLFRQLARTDRIAGGIDRPSTEKAVEFYKTFVAGQILRTDSRTSELATLVTHAFRDVNIAFANELSILASRHGIDVWELINIANRHPFVDILQPGPGVGGPCLSVDPWFMVASGPELTPLTRTAREVNEAMPARVVEMVRGRANRLREPVIAALGLAYKADTEDLDSSPSVEIVRTLARDPETRVLAADPFVSDLPPDLAELGVTLLDAKDAVAQADIIVLLVDHREYVDMDYHAFQDKVIIDTRGVWR